MRGLPLWSGRVGRRRLARLGAAGTPLADLGPHFSRGPWFILLAVLVVIPPPPRLGAPPIALWLVPAWLVPAWLVPAWLVPAWLIPAGLVIPARDVFPNAHGMSLVAAVGLAGFAGGGLPALAAGPVRQGPSTQAPGGLPGLAPARLAALAAGTRTITFPLVALIASVRAPRLSRLGPSTVSPVSGGIGGDVDGTDLLHRAVRGAVHENGDVRDFSHQQVVAIGESPPPLAIIAGQVAAPNTRTTAVGGRETGGLVLPRAGSCDGQSDTKRYGEDGGRDHRGLDEARVAHAMQVDRAQTIGQSLNVDHVVAVAFPSILDMS